MDLPMIWASIQDDPVVAPPPGVVPNLTNPASRASEIYVAAGVCLPLIVSFAAMRLYAKVAILKKWTWDDVAFSFGLLTGLVYLGLALAAATGGVYGKHLYEVTFREYTASQLLLALVFEAVYGPFIWFIKLALFLLYVQVFRPLRWLRYLAYFGAVSTGLFYLAVMIAVIVLCAPRDGDSALATLTALDAPRCSGSEALVIVVLGVVSLISDLYLVILPLPAVWSLQLSLRRKIAVSAMFFTGSVACIASAFALAYRIELTKSQDPTWLFVPLGVVTNVEFTAGLLVCCMPTITAVFKELKSPVSSWISSYRKGFRSISNSGPTARYELNSVTNLQPPSGGQTYENSSESANGAQTSWEGRQYQGSEQLSQLETGSYFASEDAGIRKTTHIKVTA